MTTLPIRIAIRVDFSDGSQHEYEVLGPDAVAAADLPPGPMGGFWPAGVVTTDVAERMKHDNARSQALADAVFRLNEVRDWAERIRDLDASDPVPDDEREAGYRNAARDVLRILDKP